MDFSDDEDLQYTNRPPGDELIDEESKKAVEVYQQTWQEFYAWEQDHCYNTLQSLHPEHYATEEEELVFSYDDGDMQEFDFDQGTSSYWVEAFDDDEVPNIYYSVEPEDIMTSRRPMTGFPHYTICTPSSSNYVPQWETSESATSELNFLSYVPFADDPVFSAEKYVALYPKLEWQTDFPDPDLEVIQLETATRLHRDHEFAFPQIDRLKMLRKIRNDRTSGLLWDTAQRDIPWWTALFAQDSGTRALSRRCFLSSPPEEPDLFVDVNLSAPYFCPKRTCLRVHCSSHGDLYPGLDKPKPKVSKKEIREACQLPCSDGCLFHLPVDEDDLMIDWDAIDNINTVQSIINVLPDTSPCDLAVICRISCREVFALRCQMFKEEAIERNKYKDPAPQLVRPAFVDGPRDSSLNNPEFVPALPCHHPGPCDQYSSCGCYAAKQHCQRSCRCEVDCEIRWKGCKCGRSMTRGRRKMKGPSCMDVKCDCRAAGRECDPELCLGCDARGVIGAGQSRKKGGKYSRLCRNVLIQRGVFQRPYITKGAFGFGAFALKSLDESAILGEYIAEIIPDLNSESFERVDVLNSHTGLNYMFSLNRKQGLDALRMGNETRYINDPRNLNVIPNCAAHVYTVDGDHRIVIQTTRRVEKGQELYLDYGEEYWTAGHNTSAEQR